MIYLGIFLLTFLSLGLFAMALTSSSREQKVSASLQRLDGYSAKSFRELELSKPLGDRVLAPAAARLGPAVRLLTPAGRLHRLQDKIEQAGRPWNLDLNALLAIKFLSLVLATLALVILASLQVVGPLWFVILGTAFAALTYYLPDIVLHFWRKQRQAKIQRTLPDFMDLLTVSVEAGLGLDSALARIAEKLGNPLREEILITLHHMRVGQNREAALRELARRCGVKDFENFVVALIQSQRLGVGLGKVMRIQSAEMRRVRRQRVEEAAQKAPIKMLFPLVFCIFPALFVVILGPAVIQIYQMIIQGVFAQ